MAKIEVLFTKSLTFLSLILNFTPTPCLGFLRNIHPLIDDRLMLNLERENPILTINCWSTGQRQVWHSALIKHPVPDVELFEKTMESWALSSWFNIIPWSRGRVIKLSRSSATLRLERRLSLTAMMSLPSKSNIQMQNYIHEIKHANVENLFL